MKISAFSLLLLFAFSTPFLGAQNVRIKVVDGLGVPVPRARAEVWFLGFTGDDDVKKSGITNQDGDFTGSGSSKHSIDIVVTKEGYYKSEIKGLDKEKDHAVEVVLREMRDPVPLFAREVRLDIHEFGAPVGFDLAVGDWIGPHGAGKVGDVFIEFRREFKGMKYAGAKLQNAMEMSKKAAAARNEVWSEEEFRVRGGKWDAEVELSFSDGGGIVEESESFLPYSELKLPHRAPEDGFSASTTLEGSTYGQASEPFVGGFYLRTRVEKKDNKIIKANFSKIYGGIEVDARGRITFTYYFNPTPNERNLEFDPNANLAVEQRHTFNP